MIDTLYDCFKPWSKDGSVYILSDTHFDDTDCKFMSADWVSPDEQIKIINSLVYKNDTLVLLGDVGNIKYVKQLKAGHKVLITGNHDRGSNYYKRIYDTRIYPKDQYPDEKEFSIMLRKTFPDKVLSYHEEYSFHSPFEYWKVKLDNNLFDEVYTGPLFISDKILLSHEPIYNDCWFNIHGHRHSDNLHNYMDENYLNCCANVINYTPVNLKNLISSGILKNISSIHRKTIDKAISAK